MNKPHLILGYFFGDMNKRKEFVVLGEAYAGGIINTSNIISLVGKSTGYHQWIAACLDVGGSFAGMTRQKDDGYTKVGPSTKGTQEFSIVGHRRERFFTCSWGRF